MSIVTVLLVSLVGTITWLAHSNHAHANQTTPPPYAHSWYINNIANLGNVPAENVPPSSSNSALYALGYWDAQWDGSNCTNSLVVLDFGQPAVSGATYGTYMFDSSNSFVSDSQVQQAAEDYAYAWYGATPTCPRLTLVIGTSNYNECKQACNHTTDGQQWANVTSNVAAYVSQRGFASQETVAAGDDMETEWDSPSTTDLFVQRWNGSNSSSSYFYDFGDATPNKGWSSSQIYYVAWGAASDVPLPEIYDPANYFYQGSPDQASTWITVEQYGGGKMTMFGAMTECTSPAYNFSLTLSRCSSPSGQYAPHDAWNDLWTAQNNAGYGQSNMSFATNIKYQGQS